MSGRPTGKKTFYRVAIAGTFDRLHRGHERFIREAFAFGERVVIGVTSDVMAGKKLESGIRNQESGIKIEPFNQRKGNLEAFLRKEGLLGRAEIVTIHDLYGPAIEKDSGIEALLVTRDTLAGARAVNTKRRELGLDPLRVRLMPFVLAKNRRRIASTKIRRGDMDRAGTVYSSLPLWGRKVPEPVRATLKKPQGRLIPGNPAQPEGIWTTMSVVLKDPAQNGMVVTVGDAVTKIVARHIPQRLGLAIVDLRENRRTIPAGYHDHGFVPGGGKNLVHLRVKNTAGFVSRSLVKAISGSIKRYQETGKPSVIEVIGEEDLAAMPAILLAPLGSLVIYGQPPFAQGSGGAQPVSGVVIVEVTEEKKDGLMDVLIGR